MLSRSRCLLLLECIVILCRYSLSRRLVPSSIQSVIAAVNSSSSMEDQHDLAFVNAEHNRRLMDKGRESHRVTGLPDAPDLAEAQYAGFIPVGVGSHANIFYWLFESRKSPKEDPIVIWLNGGPGCSSMDGLFVELGPYKMTSNRKIVMNQLSWNMEANLLFIDQPVGTGLSYSTTNTYARNDLEVNTAFYEFLEKFFRLHSQLTTSDNIAGVLQTRDVYFSGESHAGHYIPSVVAFISQKNNEQPQVRIKVKGILIGNGWIDPINQYDVSDFAHSIGLISAQQKNSLKKMEQSCVSNLKAGRLKTKVCFDLLDDVVESSGMAQATRVSMYDSRDFTKLPNPFPPNHEFVEQYMNRKDVKIALNLGNPPQVFRECQDSPYNALSHQDGKSIMKEISQLLNSGMRILFYSGQYDLICNHLGNEKALDELDWRGRDQWLSVRPQLYTVKARTTGYMKSYQNLLFLLVLDAGHMVPLNQPEVALDMLKRFITGQSFGPETSKISTSKVDSMKICQPNLLSPDVSNHVTPRVTSGVLPQLKQVRPMIPVIGGAYFYFDGGDSMYNANVITEQGNVAAHISIVKKMANITEIFISGLTDGQPNVLDIHRLSSVGDIQNSALRVVVVTGCYLEGYLQCCNHGVCGLVSGNGDAACFCAAGSFGQFCHLSDSHTNISDFSNCERMKNFAEVEKEHQSRKVLRTTQPLGVNLLVVPSLNYEISPASVGVFASFSILIFIIFRRKIFCKLLSGSSKSQRRYLSLVKK